MKYAIIKDSNFDRAKHILLYDFGSLCFVKKLTVVRWFDIRDNWITSYDQELKRLQAYIKTYDATFNRFYNSNNPKCRLDNMALCEAVLDYLGHESTLMTEQKDILTEPRKYVRGQAIYSMSISGNNKLQLYN